MSDQRLGVDTGFLADLTRLVSGGVLVVDDGGDLVWADDDARDLFGLDRGGDSVPDVFDADGEWLAPDERPYMRAFETGEPIHDLSCRASVDGARRPVTVDAVPLTDRDGVSRVALAVDVDDAFDEPASELDEVLERIDDAFIALDTDWRFTYVNGRAEELLERSAADLLGTNIWDAFSEAVGTTFQEQYERAMETQEPVAFDEYYPPLDEWFEVRAYPSETGLSVYFKDITDRKERERELERYESIVETTDDGVYVVDESGRFTMVNEAYADLVGYSRDELVGAPRSKVVSDEVVERADEIHRELRETDTDTARLEAELETAAGETITAEATFSLVEQGDETRRVGVVRDVTERKERERELETRSRQQRAVADLGRDALADPALDDFLDRAASVVADVLDNDYCKVLDLDADGDELLLRQGVGWNPGVVGEATVSAHGDDSQAAYTLRQRGPVVVEDLDADERFSGPDLLTDHDVTSGISVVIGSADDPWGILGTHDTASKSFSEHDVDFVQSIANLVAATIDNHDRRRTLEETTEVFRTANDVAVRDAPIEDRARDLLALGREYLGLDVGFQTRIDAGTQTIELVSGQADRIREGEQCPLEQAYCKTVMDEEGLVAVSDAVEAGWVGDPAYETWGIDAYVGHVLVVDGEPYGSIGFAAADPRPEGFSELELAFVEQVAQWLRYELTRRERETELAERRERYRTLIDNVPNGAVVQFDRDLRYTTIGGSTPESVDRSIDEIEGKRVSEALPPELAEQLVPNYRATLAGERRQFTLVAGDEVRKVHTVPITDDEGNVVSGMAIAQDITDRRRRERELRQQREQLAVLNDINSLVQHISETVVEQSDPAAIASAIRSHVRESAFYRAAWIGNVNPDRDAVVHAENAAVDADAPPVDPPLDIEDGDGHPAVEAIRTDEVQVVDVRPDAEERPPWMTAAADAGIEAMAAVPLTFEGALYGVLTVSTSRTNAFGEAERATLRRLGTIVAHAFLSIDREAQLRRSERLYRRLAENIPGGAVTMVDTDLRYQVAAGELLDWLDLDVRELRGRRPSEVDVLSESTAERVECNLRRALDGDHVTYEMEFDDHVLEIQTLPIRNEGGTDIVGAMSLSRDITDRVERKQELEHERERLELLIRLIRHNFLNSLNVVDARLALLEGRVDYEVSDHLDTAQERTAEMIDLVETIRGLTNATIESDEHELEPVSVRSVLSEEVESVATTYPDAEFTVGDLPRVDVRADNLLGEALGNVLHNAVQHNDKSTPRVTVDATATEETVTISIADNGPGIPADLEAKVFEKGTRGFQSPGTGFGLHIVREIVDSYDGEITVLDNDPEGTVFRITLDRAD